MRDFNRDSREAMDYEKTEILRNHILSYELNFLYVFQEMQKRIKNFYTMFLNPGLCYFECENLLTLCSRRILSVVQSHSIL